MRRPAVLAWLSIALVLVAGCATNRPAGPDPIAQKKIKADLIHQLEALPGAKTKAYVDSSLDGGQNNTSAIASVPATATTAQLTTLADTFERTIWLSHLDPMGRIGINITRAGDKVPVLQRLYQDSRPLRIKYGPRPDGLRG